jgi:phosphotransacetylase/acyl dehydratase
MRLQSKTLADLALGDWAELRRLVTQDDLYVFAASSGNVNPEHLHDLSAEAASGHGPVAPGMFVASLISAVLGTQLPGAGTLYRRQLLNFHARVHVGDELLCRVQVVDKLPDGTVQLATTVHRLADRQSVLSGEAVVLPPAERLHLKDVEVPGLVVQRHRHFDALLQSARQCPALPTAVVCPEDESTLAGALMAAREGLIVPVLVGRGERMQAAAARLGEPLDGLQLIHTDGHDEAASAVACALVRDGLVGAVMKGHLHTDDLLRPMLDKTHGLRVGRRFTHVFVMDVPGLLEPVMVTDAAINIAPDLATKVDICQNAIDLALALGMEPRVGVLSAVEMVNPAIQSSIDAALLSKMAERGQIIGGMVEGPLAMDNAIDLRAARTKGLKGQVAGRANILVVPGLDAGNMLAKQLAFVSHAEGAGLLLGARVPVILNSRADSAMSRLASCAVAVLHNARKKAAS